MTKICPICKTETEGPEKFCKECGERLVDKDSYYKNSLNYKELTEKRRNTSNSKTNNDEDNPDEYHMPISQIIRENSPRPIEEYNLDDTYVKEDNDDYIINEDTGYNHEDSPIENDRDYGLDNTDYTIKEDTNYNKDYSIENTDYRANEDYTIKEDTDYIPSEEYYPNQEGEYQTTNTYQPSREEYPEINRNQEQEVEEIIETMEMEESNTIYPIHTIEENPYSEYTKSDMESVEEFIEEKDLKERENRRLNKKHFKVLHKHGTLILVILIIIAIGATFTFNYINENSLNYINPTNEPGEYSNKIITFKLPTTWEEFNESETNVIGSYAGRDNGHNIVLSVYQSKDSNRNLNQIKSSTENLDLRNGALIENSTIKEVNGIQMYDVISKNGTKNYEYRTFGFIKDKKEYGFLFVSDDIDSYNDEIENIEKSIKYIDKNPFPF